MPLPLIAAGGAALRANAAAELADAAFANEQAKKKKKGVFSRLYQTAQALRVVWVAGAIDLWQFTLGMMIIPFLGYTEEVAEVAADTVGGVTGTVASVAINVVAFFSPDTITELGVSLSLVIWLIMTLGIVLGYLACGFALKMQGVVLVGEEHAGTKLTLLIGCLTFDYVFFIGGIFPGLTMWTLYLALNPD